MRTKFETVGYVRLDDLHADALSNAKIAHVALLAPSVPLAVLVAYFVGFDSPARLPMLAFLLAEIIAPSEGRADRARCRHVGRTMGAWISGSVAFGALYRWAQS